MVTSIDSLNQLAGMQDDEIVWWGGERSTVAHLRRFQEEWKQIERESAEFARRIEEETARRRRDLSKKPPSPNPAPAARPSAPIAQGGPSMTSYIPQVDIAKFNGETARQFADGAREELMQGAEDTQAYANVLELLITATLKKFGLDERGGWGGRSGQASKSAKKVTRALRKAAQAQENAAAHFAAFQKLYQAEVDAPIEHAKRLMSSSNGPKTLDY